MEPYQLNGTKGTGSVSFGQRVQSTQTQSIDGFHVWNYNYGVCVYTSYLGTWTLMEEVHVLVGCMPGRFRGSCILSLGPVYYMDPLGLF